MVFSANGYSFSEIQQAMKKSLTDKTNRLVAVKGEKLVLLPFYNSVSAKIVKLVGKFRLKLVYRTTCKLRHWLRWIGCAGLFGAADSGHL